MCARRIPKRFIPPWGPLVAAALACAGCGSGGGEGGAMKIIFLHHSTGKVVWDAGVKDWFKRYGREHGVRYRIEERAFPKESPYGWNNYPYDYWNIWVANGGGREYMKEPTLETLARDYEVVVLKHCFPVSDIVECPGGEAVDSDLKCIGNYKLQYAALREKMRSFAGTRFIVWTGAALVRGATDGARAGRARAFFEWVRDEWDEPGDNIFVWDFFELETDGGLYLKDEYARSTTNSHPNPGFAARVAPLFCRRVVDVIEGRGDSASRTGE